MFGWGKFLISVGGRKPAQVSISERSQTATTQPVGNRDAARSKQEWPQAGHPPASALPTQDQDPVSP